MQELGIKLTAQGAANVNSELGAVEGGLKRFAQASGQMGKGAELAGWQVSALSNQIQDFAIQVQGGANPLTAFTQQFSQVSAQFGGMKNALSALGSLITPTSVALAGLAGIVGGVGYAFMSGAKESAELRGSLALTGNMAGITADKYSLMAHAIANSSKGGIGDAKEALQALVASGRLSSESLGATGAAVAALSKATGQGADEIAKKFAAMIDDVSGGALELNKQYNFLTADQYKYIKSLQDAGESQKALAVAMEAFLPRANAHADSIGTIGRAWDGAKKAVSGYWDAAKGIGREQTVADQLRSAEERLSALGRRGGSSLQTDQRRDAILDQIKALRQAAAYEEVSAYYAGAAAEHHKDGVKWLTEGDKYLSRQAQYDKEKFAIQELAKKALDLTTTAGQKELATRLDALKEKYKDLGSEGRKAAAELQKLIDGGIALSADLLNQSSGIAPDFNEKWAKLAAAYKAGKVSLDDLIKSQSVLLSQQPAMKAAADADRKAAEDAAKARRDEADGIEKYFKAQEEAERQSMKALTGRVTSLQDEQEALALSRVKNIGLAEAIELVVVARLRERQQTTRQDSPAWEALQREIDARRDLAALIGSKANTEATQKAADEAARIWEQTSAQIGDALYEAVGGSWAGIKRLIESQVIRPVVMAGLNGITGGISGALSGTSGSGNALGTLGGLGSSFGGSVGSGLFKLGEATGSSWLQYNAFSLGDMASKAGTFAGYVDAAFQAKAGHWGTAMGEAAGAYLGGPIGSILGKLIGSAADSLFSGGAGTPHMGGYVSVDSLGGVRDITKAQGGIQQADTQTAVAALATQLNAALVSGSKAFGIEASSSIRAVFEADGHDAAWGIFQVLSAAGVQTSGFGAKGTFASDPTQGFTQFSAEAAQAIKDALLQIDLPAWASDALGKITTSDGADALAATVQQIVQAQTAIVAFGAQFQGLGGMFAKLAGLSSDATNALAQASGGLDKLTGSLGSYFTNFYSASEQSSMRMQQLGETLAAVGLAVPGTRDAFRSLVEAQDLNTTAGRSAYAALIGVAGAFADLVPVVETTAEAVGVASSKFADLMAGASSFDGFSPKTAAGTTRTDSYNAAGQVEVSDLALQMVQQSIDAGSAATGTASYNLRDRLATYDAFGGTLSSAFRDAILNTVDAIGTVQHGGDARFAALKSASGGIGGDAAAQKLVQDQLAATKSLIDSLDSLEQSLTSYAKNLLIGDLSSLSPEAKYAEAKAAFASITRQAQAGDQAAGSQVQASADAFLRLSKDFNASGGGFVADFNAVLKAIQDTNAKLEDLKMHAAANVTVSSAGFGAVVAETQRTAQATATSARAAQLAVQRGL